MIVHSDALKRDLFSFEIVARVVEKCERHSLTSSCWGRILVAAVLLEQKISKGARTGPEGKRETRLKDAFPLQFELIVELRKYCY